MEEELKEKPNEEQKPAADANTHGKNWVTDMYDKMNVSVNALNIALIVLAVFILAVIILASKH